MFPDPRGGRVYSTGDMFRYVDDGSFRFVGAIDTQVKVSGQRIELGEIEHYLFTTAGNDDRPVTAVVVPKAGTYGGRLVVVVAFDRALAQGQILRLVDLDQKSEQRVRLQRMEFELAASLPLHMVPHVWLIVHSLPVNASGKTNRKSRNEWVDGL